MRENFKTFGAVTPACDPKEFTHKLGLARVVVDLYETTLLRDNILVYVER